MKAGLVFVYYRQTPKEIKVLNLDDAKNQNDNLLSNGWEHTATLDACKWIEYLFNQTEAEDIIANVYELSNSQKHRTKVG